MSHIRHSPFLAAAFPDTRQVKIYMYLEVVSVYPVPVGIIWLSLCEYMKCLPNGEGEVKLYKVSQKEALWLARAGGCLKHTRNSCNIQLGLCLCLIEQELLPYLL